MKKDKLTVKELIDIVDRYSYLISLLIAKYYIEQHINNFIKKNIPKKEHKKRTTYEFNYKLMRKK